VSSQVCASKPPWHLRSSSPLERQAPRHRSSRV
jgi:hypothetical protein